MIKTHHFVCVTHTILFVYVDTLDTLLFIANYQFDHLIAVLSRIEWISVIKTKTIEIRVSFVST